MSLHYHSHLYDPDQIDRIGGYFVRVLELMAAEPAAHDERPLAAAGELESQQEPSATAAEAVDPATTLLGRSTSAMASSCTAGCRELPVLRVAPREEDSPP